MADRGNSSELQLESAGSELVVIARPEAEVRATPDGLTAAAADVGPVEKALGDTGALLRPMFAATEERAQALSLEAALHAPEVGVPELSVYYSVDAPEDTLEDLAAGLAEAEAIEAAYVKPPAWPAEAEDGDDEGAAAELNTMLPAEELPPAVTPDFTPRQGYLDVAPGGIDARFAWTQPGGEGGGVRIIDIEGAWRFTHEDLLQNQGGVIGGTQSTDIGWRNHGTAVVGEFGGDRNAFGVTGICPAANVRAISIFGLGSGPAIVQAANALSAGDIILIELHRPGPLASGVGQDGFIAIEWWPDDFDAILFATAKGVIVVEAAGNGAENLDDPAYNNPQPGFPATWRNPFNRALRDSRAVVVGAGAPPPGTHGTNVHGPDRSRLGFSNWGSCVDVQGWGREVTTTGYGDLQGGTNENVWYTDTFSGTSSASPIVVGALGCLQGIAIARGFPRVTPPRARQIMRSTGSPQQDAPGRPATQRIGNRPNLRAAIPLLKPKEKEKEKELRKERKDLKDRKERLKDRKEKELRKERKDLKDSKERLKDRKELEKRIKEKEQLEKRIKEKDKDNIEKDIREKVREKSLEIGGAASSEEESLEDRVAHLEGVIEELELFIGGELRPDLASAAFDEEYDDGELDQQAADAKNAKDDKDREVTPAG
jgi:hypothetical protein